MTDGLAVIGENDTLVGVARIPLCECDDRGCGNEGVQLAAAVVAGDLPLLVESLRNPRNLSERPR